MTSAEPSSGPTGSTVRDEGGLLALAESTARMGFWSWDVGADRVLYSDELYRLHGVAPGALGDRLEDYLAFVHPDDRPSLRDGAWSAAAGATASRAYRFVHPDGGVRHFEGRATMLRDQAGTGRHLVGTIQDVTEVRRARRNALSAFSRLSAYFDETPMPAYLWRQEGDALILRRLNKAARANWGDEVARLEGAPSDEVCADRPDVVADIRACMRTQTSITRETYWESDRRGHRPIVLTYVPVAADSVVAHVEDVSDLLAAGERAEAATSLLAGYFQRVPTPAYLWREKGDGLILEAVNQASLEVTGGGSREMVGQTADAVYADRPDILEDLHRALSGETFSRRIRYETRFSSDHEALDLVVTYVHIPPDSVVAHAEDVTSQSRMASALRDSNVTVEGVLDASRQPILMIDADGTLLTMNGAACAMLEGDREELLGRRMWDLFEPGILEGRRRVVSEVLRSGRPAVHEDERNGVRFRARLYPLVDEAGEVARVVVYAEDVTEEHASRTALLRSRERLEEAQRVGHLGHWDWHVELDELLWSDEACRIFGAQTSPNVSFQALMDRVHPEDREAVRAFVQDALDAGGAYSFEHRVLGVDGAMRFVREQGEVTRSSEGGPVMAGTVLDITMLKAAEEAIRAREAEMTTIIERNPDGICVIVDGKIGLCNSSMVALIGCSREAILGRTLSDLMVPEDRTRALARRDAVLAGAPTEPKEYALQRCDGSTVEVEIYGAVFPFRGERALICTLRDIRERKRAARELAESRDALRALTQHLEMVREQERAQVARDLHDELGSVLTALKIDVGELESVGLREEGIELLAEMSQLVDRAIETGRSVTSRLRPGVLDDLGLAAAAEWLGADLQKRTGVRCRVELPEAEPLLPESVATTMFRILQEALTNVTRHADADSVDIILEDDGRRVALTVSDTGRGFDPSDADVQGFGLLGMRERVRSFGGTFEVESAPGAGATIRVTLPSTP